jgi:hypothetical protein
MGLMNMILFSKRARIVGGMFDGTRDGKEGPRKCVKLSAWDRVDISVGIR